MTWILTHSGYKFDLLNPTAAMVHPADIVHALSMICRFNGHSRRHYSVAQHSLTVVAILALEDRPDDEKLAGLLHDAPEAYISDLTRPLKQAMRGFSTARQRTWMMQADAMGLDAERLYERVANTPMQHAAGEAFNVLESFYHQVEARIWRAICQRFDLPEQLPASVKRADMVALATEKRDLMPTHPETWPCLNGIEPAPFAIPARTPVEARELFHNSLLNLLGSTHRARASA